jgi:DNA-binding transcriptional regulator YiaG
VRFFLPVLRRFLSLSTRPAPAGKRIRERVSQPVFARYLNVSKNLVSDWERGVKKPGGPALRLLAVVQKGGLNAIV